MAFATLVDQTDSDTSGTGQVPDLGSYTVGNLLICEHIRVDGTAFSAPGNNWVELWQGAVGSFRGGIWAKVADGTDQLTITGGNANGCSIVDEWSGHGGLPEMATPASGSSTNANPPNLAPSWAARDTTWKAVFFGGASVQATAAPSSFTNLHTQAPAGSGRLATAERQLNAASLDPGTFTNTSTTWVTATLAILPVAAVPGWKSAGTALQTTTAAPAFDAPSGIRVGDIITCSFHVDGTATVTAVPSGFTICDDIPVSTTGASGGSHSQRFYKYWKRATTNEATSDTYAFTLSASAYVNGIAECYDGCIATGSPWDADPGDAFDNAAGTVTPTVSTTTQGPYRLLVFNGTNWAGGAWTPPAGFTERSEGGSDKVMTSADLLQGAAGSSGSVTATCVGSNKRTAWLGALRATPTVSTPGFFNRVPLMRAGLR